jgi:hypothetical protein
MTRPIDKSPHGALKLPDARTAKGPWYTVDKEYGQITKRNHCRLFGGSNRLIHKLGTLFLITIMLWPTA